MHWKYVLRPPSRWGIKLKVGLVLSVLILVSILSTGFMLMRAHSQEMQAEAINRTGELRMLSQRLFGEMLLLERSPGRSTETLGSIQVAITQRLDELLGEKYDEVVQSPSARDPLLEVRKQWNGLVPLIEKATERSSASGWSTYDLRTTTDSISDAADRAVVALERTAEARIDRLITVHYLFLALILLVAGGIVLVLWQALDPLVDLTRNAERLAEEREEDVTIDVETNDEIGRLATAFRSMAEQVRIREEELRRIKTHYEKIFHDAPYGITVTTLRGEFVDANRAALDLFGMEWEELRDLNARALYEDTSQREDFIDKVTEGGAVRDFEAYLRRGDGSRFLSCISTSVRTVGDRILLQTIIQDITKARENEQRRKVFEQAVEQSGDMIFITDPDGTIWYANPASEEVTGYTRDTLVGNTPQILKSGEVSRETYDQLWATIERGEVFQDTLVDRRKDGSSFYLEQTITPILDADGEINFFVSTGRDVTDRVQREEQMEVLNRVLRHDVGNAAAGVLGWTDMLRETDDEAQRDQYRGYIRQAAAKITRLTESARAIMRSIRDDAAEPVPVDIVHIVEQEIQSARNLYEGITIAGLPDHIGPVCVLGTELLSPVIANLLHNAVYHASDLPVHVDVSIADTEGGAVQIRIADDGPGISDDRKEDIFGQGEKGLESSGTGMGLYLARQVVRDSGGRIWAEDNMPSGAVFVVKLCKATGGVEAHECEQAARRSVA